MMTVSTSMISDSARCCCILATIRLVIYAVAGCHDDEDKDDDEKGTFSHQLRATLALHEEL